MSSLNSAVTDSAAASSSWGSGSRVCNGAINTLPDGRKLTPITRLAKEKGRATGLVTTATVTHATPAGFAAVQGDRDNEAAIAPEYLDVADVVLGGGRRFFEHTSRPDGCDLVGEYRGRGYQCIQRRHELSACTPAKRVLGLFADGHVPYRIDRAQQPDLFGDIPTLEEITRCALRVLDCDRHGFLLQVEGARIDHAAHGNDAAGLLWGQLEFDDALGTCLEYQRRRPHTLIVVTSDHGNSNPGLNGMGAEYSRSNQCFAKLAAFRASHQELARRLGGKAEYSGIRRASVDIASISPERASGIVADATGITLTRDELDCLCAALSKSRRVSPADQQNNLEGTLGAVLGNHSGIG